MIPPLLTRKVLLSQLLYEMACGGQNRGVHHKKMNKGEDKQFKRTEKYKKWKEKIKVKEKG